MNYSAINDSLFSELTMQKYKSVDCQIFLNTRQNCLSLYKLTWQTYIRCTVRPVRGYYSDFMIASCYVSNYTVALLTLIGCLVSHLSHHLV